MFLPYFLLTLSLGMPPQADADPGITEIVLKQGDEAELDGGQFRVRFEAVIADSRCPRGYRCISAGEAKVRLWVKEASEPGQSQVVAGPARTFSPVSKNHAVRIRALEPYPVGGAPRPTEYTLTLAVR